MKETKHVKTLTAKTFKDTICKGGCGECQTSCQSACKTSCTVGNQKCENKDNWHVANGGCFYRAPYIITKDNIET